MTTCLETRMWSNCILRKKSKDMAEFETEVKAVIKRTENVKSFRFALKGEINFLPGQFFFVTIKIDGEEATKHFSFSNSPTEAGYIEFTKRLTGSEFSNALEKLKTGDWARLRLAYGQFTPLSLSGRESQDEYPKFAFLAGGIGITPVRSICKFATDRRMAVDIILLYSSNTPKDIVFKDDFNEIQAANKKLKVVETITLPDESRSWAGRTGRIDKKMIEEEIPDYRQRLFYISGPPAMVEAMKEILTSELKLTDEKIKTENFTGYK